MDAEHTMEAEDAMSEARDALLTLADALGAMAAADMAPRGATMATLALLADEHAARLTQALGEDDP